MARRRRYEPLNVFLNSRLVGQLRRTPGGAISFTYDEEWVGWTNTMPVSLSLPLQDAPYTAERVVAVFENLLPDNQTLRRQIAARVHAKGTDAYSMLSAIGHDCVGALQFMAVDAHPGPAGLVNGTALGDREIEEMLANLRAAPLGISEDDDFRISIAGAQEKTALLWWNDRWYKPSGTTATTHIFKPSIGQLPNGVDLSYSVENEYLCLKILDSLGLRVASAQISRFGERTVLIVERFDRSWTKDGRLLRLPQEDCCQALSVLPTLKYENEGGPGIEDILTLLRGSDTPTEDQREFLKAVIAFWLIGATDGHAKNFSIFLYPGGRYRMTPLYDVISAQPSLDAGQIRPNAFKLAMAVGTNRHYRINTVMPRHFIETAGRAGVGHAVVQSIFAEFLDIGIEAINRTVADLPASFPTDVSASIRSGFLRRIRLIANRP